LLESTDLQSVRCTNTFVSGEGAGESTHIADHVRVYLRICWSFNSFLQ